LYICSCVGVEEENGEWRKKRKKLKKFRKNKKIKK
jgi:hypothetical protein